MDFFYKISGPSSRPQNCGGTVPPLSNAVSLTLHNVENGSAPMLIIDSVQNVYRPMVETVRPTSSISLHRD